MHIHISIFQDAETTERASTQGLFSQNVTHRMAYEPEEANRTKKQWVSWLPCAGARAQHITTPSSIALHHLSTHNKPTTKPTTALFSLQGTNKDGAGKKPQIKHMAKELSNLAPLSKLCQWNCRRLLRDMFQHLRAAVANCDASATKCDWL